jgi:N-acetylmuramic acid 6-phosphate etherase
MLCIAAVTLSLESHYDCAMSKGFRKTEEQLPDVIGIDTWGDQRILETLLGGQQRALGAVHAALPQIGEAADQIAKRLRGGGRLFYAGAGTSIRVAVQDGSELHSTFGMEEGRVDYLIAGGPQAMFETFATAEDDAGEGAKAASVCTARDALIAVAASGSTPYTIAAAETAKANGAYVVSVVNNADSKLGAAGDIEILLNSGPEVISGSTRMGAGTAQKIALNFLSTLAHIKLGAVHDGLMVNVLAGNAKLVDRARRIVMQISGADAARAGAALDQAGGRVKIAVLLCSGASSVAEAEVLLERAQGHLRAALAAK